jgi:beta-glucosidase
VTFKIGKDALSYFDAGKHEWVAEPGDFEAVVAASAADVKSTVKFKLVE